MDAELTLEPGQEPASDFLEEETRREIHKFGLPSDYFNKWNVLNMLSESRLEILEPISTFAEFVNNEGTWSRAFKNFILISSNKDKISQVDELAKEFNADLARMQAEKDLTAARFFLSRAQSIQKS